MGNAAEKLKDLFNFEAAIQAIQELSDILRNEIPDIKNNNIKKITDNQLKKADLIQYVENVKDLLKQYPEISKELPNEKKSLLKKVAQDLQESITLNNSELMKAKYFNDELIKLIVSTVQNASSPVKTYNKEGKRTTYSKLKTPASVTFNKEI
jgi:RNA polymerase-interacting CarD/CdnL/TRCF family regulator